MKTMRALGCMVLWLALTTAAAAQTIVGIEYGNSPLTVNPVAARFKPLTAQGVTAVKFTDVSWGDIQPYDWPAWCFWCTKYLWTDLDGRVKDWQANGFTDIHMVVRAKHPTFTSPTVTTLPPGFPSYAVFGSSNPPNADKWGAYAAWVQALVERYDGDGKSDMPGLKQPILIYEFESEQQDPTHWRGTVQDYLKLLATARQAALAASPKVQVILGGLTFGDMLDDAPSTEVVYQRLATTSEPWHTLLTDAYAFGIETFKHPELFELVEYHSMSDASGIGPAFKAIREQFAANGYTKPIWVGDAMATPVTVYTPGKDFNPPLPVPQMQQRLLTLLSPASAQFPAAWAQLMADQKDLTQRKIAAAVAAGAPRINICCLEDWPLSSTYPFGGIVDTNGTPRPVWSVIQSPTKP